MNFRELEQKVKDIEEKLNKITSKTHEFTEDEKLILRNISSNYGYIARDKNGDLYLYEYEPQKMPAGFRW